MTYSPSPLVRFMAAHQVVTDSVVIICCCGEQSDRWDDHSEQLDQSAAKAGLSVNLAEPGARGDRVRPAATRQLGDSTRQGTLNLHTKPD